MSSELLKILVENIPEYAVDPISPEAGDIWKNTTSGEYKTYDSAGNAYNTLTVKVLN